MCAEQLFRLAILYQSTRSGREMKFDVFESRAGSSWNVRFENVTTSHSSGIFRTRRAPFIFGAFRHWFTNSVILRRIPSKYTVRGVLFKLSYALCSCHPTSINSHYRMKPWMKKAFLWPSHTGFSVLSRTMSDVFKCNTTRILYHCPETTTVRRTEVPKRKTGALKIDTGRKIFGRP